VKASFLRNPEGKPIGILGVTRDISERKRAEEKLHIYQEQLRSLASELSLTEQRERRRLATDLHDSIGQVLAISKIKLDALRSTVPLSPVAGDLDEVRELIGEAIEQTRSLTFDLSPPVLYELGLSAAVEAFVEKIQKLHGIQVHFTDDSQPKPLSEDTRVLLFRAVQELLINSIKHGRAKNARISTQRDGDRIRIEVKDDGIGFDFSEIDSHAKKTDKFGFFSIRERLHHLGGRFEIFSRPGQGTHATLVASLKRGEVAC
jgi:signal transduction histidine kinase